MYNIIIWYLYVLQNDHLNNLVNCFHHTYQRNFFVMRTFNMYPLSNFQKCNTVLTIDTMPSIKPAWHIIFLNGSPYLFFRFYLFIFREGKEGRMRGRESSVCGCLSHIHNWEPSPQPRHVPWLEIEPASLCFSSWHSIHWVTPATTGSLYLLIPCHPLPSHFGFYT